nr:MAG TPA: hypothetical protein [Caudoviricetes sp.]
MLRAGFCNVAKSGRLRKRCRRTPGLSPGW